MCLAQLEVFRLRLDLEKKSLVNEAKSAYRSVNDLQRQFKDLQNEITTLRTAAAAANSSNVGQAVNNSATSSRTRSFNMERELNAMQAAIVGEERSRLAEKSLSTWLKQFVVSSIQSRRNLVTPCKCVFFECGILS